MARHIPRPAWLPGTRRQRWLTAAVPLLLLLILVPLATRCGAPGAAHPLGAAAPGPGSPAPARVVPGSDPASPAPSSAPSVAVPSAAPASRGVPAPPKPGPGRSAKKGVSAWYMDGVTQALADSRVSWYYNWATDRQKITSPAGVEFVPMMWGAGSVTDANLAKVRQQGRTLLGFNEPDFGSQANMTVEQALDLWPKLVATGMRLGSPAPATGAATPGGWLDRFMSGATARGYRVDFIALHWYGSDFSPDAAHQLSRYLQATYDRYHKPIWLTEYALIAFGRSPQFPTPEQQAGFVTASTAMLDGLPFVERYAWFALPTSANGDATGLYRPGGTPTPVGLAYRAA